MTELSAIYSLRCGWGVRRWVRSYEKKNDKKEHTLMTLVDLGRELFTRTLPLSQVAFEVLLFCCGLIFCSGGNIHMVQSKTMKTFNIIIVTHLFYLNICYIFST